jgi:hypothetical protein
MGLTAEMSKLHHPGGGARIEVQHRKYSFVDELKDLLGKAGIEYEEKYLL